MHLPMARPHSSICWNIPRPGNTTIERGHNTASPSLGELWDRDLNYSKGVWRRPLVTGASSLQTLCSPCCLDDQISWPIARGRAILKWAWWHSTHRKTMNSMNNGWHRRGFWESWHSMNLTQTFFPSLFSFSVVVLNILVLYANLCKI